MTSASAVEQDSKSIQIGPVQAVLPADLGELQDEARAESFRFVDRLADEWATGTNRFGREGEVLLAARVEGRLAGIGGLTWEPALTGALRMRRFYTQPAYRRLAIGRRLVEALLARPRPPGTILTVHAGTSLAPAFWEALGFHPEPGDGYSHIRRS